MESKQVKLIDGQGLVEGNGLGIMIMLVQIVLRNHFYILQIKV